MVLMVWSFAISASTLPTRGVTSAGPAGASAAAADGPLRRRPGSSRPVPNAALERKLRRVVAWLDINALSSVYWQFRNRMPKTKVEYITGGLDRELYSGLIRLHVLDRKSPRLNS